VRARLVQLWAVGLAASVLVTAASSLGWLESWQARGLDLILRLQGRTLPAEVVIVAIDDRAFDGLGRRQPLSREYLARVMRGLQRSGAAAVGVDILLASPTTADGDGALARAITRFGDERGSRVVLAGPLPPGQAPLARPEFLATVTQASPDVPQDQDGIIRRIAGRVPQPGGALPALAVAVAERAGATMPEGAGEWPINYIGPARSFLTIPSDAVAALGDSDTPVAADNPLRGRIVLVGGTFAESRDFYPTPHGMMAGVEVHANATHMIATGRFIRPSGWLVGLGVSAAVVLAAGAVFLALPPLAATLACVAGAVAIGVPASYLAFQRGGYWVDFLLPVVATCLTGLGTDFLARRRLRDSFGRYLSRELLAQVSRGTGLRGERREVSILFSDLRGFTTLSETLPPEAVAARLNEYFDAMTAAIFAHRGMINDFVGDAVMAVFGAPVPDPEHALHAVQSAAAMERGLDELNRRWAEEGLPPLRMGIGVHTGVVFAGNVGGAQRIKYTMIGDPVNVASRVEGLNKDLGTTILVTEQTLAAVGERARVKDRGPVAVKGRAEPVRVYEVLGVDRQAEGKESR
jgi:adenylate cyclase